MAKPKPQLEGHVAWEFKIGNTTIGICDDCYGGVTKEQGQVILDEAMKKIAPAYFAGAALQGQGEK